MDVLKGDQIAEANLTDWRKLAQGLHAHYLVGDFGTGAQFVAAVGEAGDAAPEIGISRVVRSDDHRLGLLLHKVASIRGPDGRGVRAGRRIS